MAVVTAPNTMELFPRITSVQQFRANALDSLIPHLGEAKFPCLSWVFMSATQDSDSTDLQDTKIRWIHLSSEYTNLSAAKKEELQDPTALFTRFAPRLKDAQTIVWNALRVACTPHFSYIIQDIPERPDGGTASWARLLGFFLSTSEEQRSAFLRLAIEPMLTNAKLDQLLRTFPTIIEHMRLTAYINSILQLSYSDLLTF